MRRLSKIVYATYLILFTTQPFAAQSTVCRIELTDIGKQARFHFNCLYQLAVQNDGSIDAIKNLREKEYPAFVREDKLVECIRTWKLEPAEKYAVSVSFGTSGDENSITIIAPKRASTLKLILP